MKIEVKIEKKHLFFLVAILILFSLFYVFGYQSGGPPDIVGHSAEEIEGVCKSDGTGCPDLGVTQPVNIFAKWLGGGIGSQNKPVPASKCGAGYKRVYAHVAYCKDMPNNFVQIIGEEDQTGCAGRQDSKCCDGWYEVCAPG